MEHIQAEAVEPANFAHRLSSMADSNHDARPGLAFIAPQQTPYRLHFLLRIVRELPQIKLHSMFTHEFGDSKWKMESPPEINPVLFGPGEYCFDQAKLTSAKNEWHRGGKMIEWMEQRRIDAVLLLGYSDAGRLRVLRWARRKRIPVYLWGDSNIRGDQVSGVRKVAKTILVRRVMKQLDAIFSCGSLGKEYFLKYGAPADKIYYMPVEPDYDQIAAAPPELIEQMRRHYRLDPSRRRLVYSGRMVDLKRVDLVVDAFVAIAQQRPNWDLLMIGGGPLEAELKARVPANLKDRVIWTGFIDGQQKISAMYRCCDALVLCSDLEPWALVINEAAAAGMAIIATDVVGAAAELVRNGVNGYTVPTGDLRTLTNRLLETTDPANIDRMKAASLQVLADWRRDGDPIQGLRQALIDTKVIS